MTTMTISGRQAVGSGAGSPSFEDFVAVRSASLLHTAYLLTRDHALVEDLLQTALTLADVAVARDGDVPRVETPPEGESSWPRRCVDGACCATP